MIDHPTHNPNDPPNNKKWEIWIWLDMTRVLVMANLFHKLKHLESNKNYQFINSFLNYELGHFERDLVT